MPGVVNQLAGGVGRFEDVVGDPFGRYRNRTRPMLELDQSSEVRIASLRILDVIQRKTGNFQNIDASEAGIRFRHKHPSCRERDGLAKPLMARLEIYSGEHDWCICEMACQCTAPARLLIACLP